MQPTDLVPIIAIAMLAARADGAADAAEEAAIEKAVTGTGAGTADLVREASALAAGQPRLGELARRLSGPDAKQLAWETALAVCHADGSANAAEAQFLEHLQDVLGVSDAAAQQQTATALAAAPVATSPAGGPAPGSVDELILQQAILTGALEVLPDRLANIAILPLQLRLVYQVGQRHGQKLDVNQVKDLAATLGLGAAAQSVEGIMMKVLGGLAGGLLGGLAGGATRIATGAAVTFTATYAFGHVADQYYAQGRKLSQADLRTLFGRFQQEARTIYPQVQQQVQTRSGSLNIQGLLASLRG